ncbi:hypothetical protein RCL_jg6437.t1 [Rhizophagus clarus]|uniref:Uncharacterized protein n=1 Tax=Rhizophagus clarus TaxID=94130 RepID=A0A8H3QNA5_9GLOM|nr:hypothetical protein RCL_jg6437.t1 [Rhizophagus clarus]
MSQHNQQDAEEELFKIFRDLFGQLLLENMEREHKNMRRMWPRSSSWDIQQNVPLRQTDGLRNPSDTYLKLVKYWDVCHFLLTYLQHLSLFTLERMLAKVACRN